MWMMVHVLIQYYGYDDAVTIHAFIDLFATEGSWQLIDANGDTIGAVVAGDMTTSALYTTELCVNNGCYQLYFQDSFGDGWSDFNGTQGWIAAIDSDGDTLSYDLVTELEELQQFLLVEVHVYLMY